MLSINARNINEAFQIGMIRFKEWDKPKNRFSSRYGDVIRAPHLVVTTYNNPTERVLFNEKRDCNPFFHLMESLWMLAGREDVSWLVQFNKRMAEFSDNGETYHGAYGYRWRKSFGFDQLESVIKELQEDNGSRRAVLQIWNCTTDLNKKSKDIPCNIMVIFDIVNDKLNITVFNRSNDMIWGAYGANVVQFSILQEYMAARLTGAIGRHITVGQYHQISANFHVYLDVYNKYRDIEGISDADEYLMKNITPYPLVENPNKFDDDLDSFLKFTETKQHFFCSNRFFDKVAIPVFLAWLEYKEKRYQAALVHLDHCEGLDWKIACSDWIKRRMNNGKQ